MELGEKSELKIQIWTTMDMVVKTIHVGVIIQGMCTEVGEEKKSDNGTPTFRVRRMERVAEKFQRSGQRGSEEL